MRVNAKLLEPRTAGSIEFARGLTICTQKPAHDVIEHPRRIVLPPRRQPEHGLVILINARRPAERTIGKHFARQPICRAARRGVRVVE